MSRKTRKLIWSAPLVAVLAVAGALALFVALAPSSAQADHVTLPGSVTDLKAEVLGRAEIELSWKNPTGPVNSYRIDTSKDTYVWESKEMTTNDVTTDADGVVTYTDTDELAENAYRYYRVFAMNSAGTGLAPLEDYVRADGIDPTIPGTTQDLVATAVGHNQINLAWSMPADDGHTDITLYCISVSRPGTAFQAITGNCDEASAVTESVTAINAALISGPTAATIVIKADGDSVGQSYEHKTLRANARYQYRVTAVNSRGAATVNSNIAFATTGSTPTGTTTTAPDAVRNLRAVRTANRVDLYWNLPADQDPTVEGYTPPNYEIQKAISVDQNLPAEDATGANGWDDEVGQDGTSETVYDWQDSSESAPAMPARVHYRVRAGTTGTWATFSMKDDAFDTTIMALTPPATTAPQDGTAPPIASNGGTLDLITLRWDDVPADAAMRMPVNSVRPTGYELDFVAGDVGQQASAVGKQYWTSLLPEGRSGYARSPDFHRDLTGGTPYIYRIFPYKDGVYGQPVETNATTEPAVAPDTRLSLRVDAEGPTKLKLTWNAPRITGGADVTGYYIEVSNDTDDNNTREGNVWISVNDLAADTQATAGPAGDGVQTTWKVDDADTTEYTYTGLNPEDARWFRVIALNSAATVTVADGSLDDPNLVADDALGSAVPVRGMTARASVPSAPNGLVAEEARNSNYRGSSNRGVLLLWNAPDDPLGDVLKGYVISRKVDDGAWDDDWKKIEENKPRTYLTDTEPLGQSEMRYYRVAAFNSAGTGAWTAEVRYPADGSHMAAIGTLDEVSGVMATSDTDGEVTVMWMGGDNADRYIVIALEKGSSPVVIGYTLAESGASEATITGLNSDMSHLVLVLALKGTGDDRELEYDTDTVTVQWMSSL